jgi:UDPglucose 6-dehydrogenase
MGHTVTGLDFDSNVIGDLQKARTPVSEPGLPELIQEMLEKKTLRFTQDPRDAVMDADVIWIAFDTPVDEQDNADIAFIESNFNRITPYIRDGTRIIISSQVPVGFTRHIYDMFNKENPGKTVFFAYSPENLRLGKALKVFLEPDRIIIGVRPEEKKLFLPVFASISDRLEWMSVESAEMTKHAINAFLATSICFANEIASVCERMGADAKEVERGLKTEERIGPKAYLNPGNAFSGGTLARDVQFLQKIGRKNHLPMYLINSVLESNDFHKKWVQRKCEETLGGLKGKHIAVLGLTYKPGTNTLRRSLSVELCCWLKEQGADVTAFDPAIQKLPPELDTIISLSSDIAGSIENADCIIIATEWPYFKTIELGIKTIMRTKIIIDPNGFMEGSFGNFHTMRYFAVGRSYT